MRVSVHQLVEGSARSAGDRPALTYRNDTLTYAQLWDSVRAVGSGLLGLGVARGDRVGVFLEKRLETVQVIFGTSAAGGAFVPVNPLLRPQQVAYVLRDCGVRVLVTSADRLELLREELTACEQLAHVIVVDAHGEVQAPEDAGYTVGRWEDLPVTGGDPAVGIDLDVAAVLYTSGSTGKPKGVVLSHRNLVVGAESVSQYLKNTADDVILSVLPLSFDAGLSQLTTGFSVGAHVVLMNYLLPADVPRMCARHGVTALTCVPPLWIQIADLSWPDEATRSLRYFANTGGRMPKTVLDRLRSVFPQASPYLMYGLT
jgi:acyl-CoA synthetase (AMP-forming)/AMP-acid ligase II